MNLKPHEGFTFLELVIVMAIGLVLVGFGSQIYGNLQPSTQISRISSEILQATRTAKSKSVARENNAAHGIFFDTTANSFTLYQGATYATRNSSFDLTTTLGGSLSLTTALTGSGDADDVNFSTGLGTPNKTGTITVTHDTVGTKTISINSLGLIEGN